MEGHTFRMKPVFVEAFQMTVRRMERNDDWPEWLRLAWISDPYRPGGLSRSKREPLLLALVLPCGTQRRVEPNDWIVRHDGGRLELMAAREFKETFERVGEPAVAHV
jgi:hypothetical protein